MDRVIIHVDMDAFFASVEQLDNASYMGKPVIVGADPRGGRGRGVVCAASYEARVYGVHSALPISKAFKLCPCGIFVRPRYERYAQISENIMTILNEFSPVIEQISIDEAFLDATGTERLFGDSYQLAKKIKNRIRLETGLNASIGVGPNKSIAKIASDLQKPDGLTICRSGNEKEFLAPLKTGYLWGAGKKTTALLEQMGLKTIGDIANTPCKSLEVVLGKWGAQLWLLANGIDDRPVSPRAERKSYSEEVTFDKDTADNDLIERTIFGISENLGRRIRTDRVMAKTIRLKIRLEGFETFSRSYTFPEPVSQMSEIRSAALERFRTFDRKGKRIRLIGIALSNFNAKEKNFYGQLELFRENTLDPGRNQEKIKDTDALIDEMKNRFGEKIKRAGLLNMNDTKKWIDI